ncbi:MAG TPA: hypothetical protein VGS22_16615 [Thermoanaerobaculia bacterium]|jgi:hypothetical protein|nr:hypothetical protein [Thermoanaerobaculia bacterium]
MKKKTPQKLPGLTLRIETLHPLDDRKVRTVAAGARAWRPTGFAPDTTPIYEYEDDTTGG